MLSMALLIAYTAVVGSTMELGENNRFKFAVESILWCFMIAVAYRGLGFGRQREYNEGDDGKALP